jgi:pimeloyl-ACP methyl ester carboxylesterase
MTSTTLQLSEPYGQASARIEGEGEPLLLIHGVGMQSASWAPQIAALSGQCRVIAVDMPGHGGSGHLPGKAELPDYLNWLDAVLDALDLDAVSLAGHSMGAMIVGGYAITRPGRVQRVALLNAVYRRSPAARAAVEARADVIRDGKMDLETPLARWFGSTQTDQAARAKVAGWLASVDLDGYAAAYGAFARGDATYADGWPDVACPMLALTGDGDPNSTPEMAVEMAEAAQSGRAVTIEGHRHMVNLTAPEAVNAHLQDWLARPAACPAERKETA